MPKPAPRRKKSNVETELLGSAWGRRNSSAASTEKTSDANPIVRINRKFLDYASIHGLKHMRKKLHNKRSVRALWFFILVISTIFFLATVKLRITEYENTLREPTYSEVIIRKKALKPPSVSICKESFNTQVVAHEFLKSTDENLANLYQDRVFLKDYINQHFDGSMKFYDSSGKFQKTFIHLISDYIKLQLEYFTDTETWSNMTLAYPTTNFYASKLEIMKFRRQHNRSSDDEIEKIFASFQGSEQQKRKFYFSELDRNGTQVMCKNTGC